jgi:hypothetical protein
VQQAATDAFRYLEHFSRLFIVIQRLSAAMAAGRTWSARHFVAAIVMIGLWLPLSHAALAADIPRDGSGRPDLSGFWQAFGSSDWDILAHAAQKPDGRGVVLGEVPASLGIVVGNDIPYQPWALAKKKENFKRRANADPRAKCDMQGVPRITYTPLPFQIFQSPKGLTILYEYAHSSRQIYINDTKHPDGHIDWWMGDSRGHWEGDTLVVDVTDFAEETWFDHVGDFHSDALHVTERYTLLDADHIQYEATIEDSKVFTRPWTISLILYRHKEKNFQLLEYECDAMYYEQFYP